MLEKISEKLTPQEAAFVKHFFAEAPDTLLSRIIMKTYPKNCNLISSDDECSYVYILLRGCLQAIEDHFSDEPYQFTELSAIDIVGDYELFTSDSSRFITLSTKEKALCLMIPAKDYIHWIRHDTNALFFRTQMLIKQLVMQGRNER